MYDIVKLKTWDFDSLKYIFMTKKQNCEKKFPVLVIEFD